MKSIKGQLEPFLEKAAIEAETNKAALANITDWTELLHARRRIGGIIAQYGFSEVTTAQAANRVGLSLPKVCRRRAFKQTTHMRSSNSCTQTKAKNKRNKTSCKTLLTG